MSTAGSPFDRSPVNVRIKLSALWSSMLFVFAYVDLFSLYRSDFRRALESGTVSGFTIGQAFLVATTLYVAGPSLMVFAVVVLPPRFNRILNIGLATLYAGSIIVTAVGEWTYYLVGSFIELAQLTGVVYYAWKWPRQSATT